MSHAPFSPSAAKRWMSCPGSVALCATLPPDPDTEWSRRGTFLHEVAANVLLGIQRADQLVGVTDGEFVVDAAMAAEVIGYVDYVQLEAAIDGGRLLVEHRLRGPLGDDCYGTADALLLQGTVLHVFDLKTGSNPISVLGNPQLLTYAYLGLQELAPKAQLVVLHIYQPAAGGGSSCTVLAEEVLRHGQQLVAAIDAAKQPGAPLVAGDHCRWCPARNGCPQLRHEALEAARETFGDLDAPPAPPEPALLAPAELARVLELGPKIEEWLAAVRADAAARLARGESVPGYKLVEKLSNRRWSCTENEAAQALQAAGVDPFTAPEVVSPAEAERRLGRQRKHLVAPLTTRVVTGTTLAPESDPRPAAVGGNVFPALPD